MSINTYSELTKYDKNIKKKHGAVIQCDKRYYFISKRDSITGGNLQNFEEHLLSCGRLLLEISEY